MFSYTFFPKTFHQGINNSIYASLVVDMTLCLHLFWYPLCTRSPFSREREQDICFVMHKEADFDMWDQINISYCMWFLKKEDYYYIVKPFYVKIMHICMCSPFFMWIWVWQLNHYTYYELPYTVVVKIPGHRRKHRRMHGNVGVHKCTPFCTNRCK